MTSATKILAALSTILVLALGYMVIGQTPGNALTKAQVEEIVAQAIAAQPTETEISPVIVANIDLPIDLPKTIIGKETIYPMVESYLLENPEILTLAAQELDRREIEAESAQHAILLAGLKSEIYDASENVILGNPDGDVTLVELFDYNCGFCKRALGDLLALLDEDPGLRVILKEFPILSQESVDAARVAVLVNQSDADYLAFHSALLSQRGQVTQATAMQAAENVGLDPLALELELLDPSIQTAIDATYQIANTLGISGTPSYILGNEIIPGAIGKDSLKAKIAALRAANSVN